MGTEVQAATDFQTRMFNSIRDKMGDLMTDDELKKVLETAVQKAFFDPRHVKTGDWRQETREIEPLFVELVRAHLKPGVEKMIGDWYRENEDKIAAMMVEQFKGGVAAIVIRTFDSFFANHLATMQMNMEQSLRNLGLPR